MLGVAVLGYGVVGSGVAELLQKNAERISLKAGQEIVLRRILDIRDLSWSPHADLAVTDFTLIENDPDIQVVVECIGGVGVALDFVTRSLRAGKHVVTSNKALVAEKGAELLALAEKQNLNFLFEASVGGGIPVLRPLSQCLAANRLGEIVGILNGTSNYILSQMLCRHLPFADALQEAKDRGYAEADPTDDISGMDACRKICILTSLAFGSHIYPVQVDTEGIMKVDEGDMRFAQENGYSVKLLARAISGGTDEARIVYVAPHFVPITHPLSGVNGVFNAVWISGDAIGEIMLYGRGAGKEPTASAIAADIIDTAKHMGTRKWVCWKPSSSLDRRSQDNLSAPWYLRTGNGGRITEPMSAKEIDLFVRSLPEKPLYRMRVLQKEEDPAWD